MSKRIVLLLMVLSLILPLSAFAYDYEEWLGKEKLADTFEDLLKQYDSTSCQNCHTDIYEQWKKSYHAKSITTSLGSIGGYMTVGIQTEWERELSREEAVKCLDCHIPQVNTATQKLAKEISNWVIVAGGKKKGASEAEKKAAYKKLEKLNINCVVCHNMKALMASASYLQSPSVHGKHIKTPSKKDKDLGLVAKVYSSKENLNSPHEVVQTNGMSNSLFCEQCHGIWPGPDGELIQCNSLSGSYEDSYRTRGGWKDCQDCHMREKNRGHMMPGGHDSNGIVKESLDLDVGSIGFCRLEDNKTKGPWHPAAIVNVGITSNAGHRIPDG